MVSRLVATGPRRNARGSSRARQAGIPQVKESRVRKATGWIAEEFTELKLKLDDPSNSDLAVIEILRLSEKNPCFIQLLAESPIRLQAFSGGANSLYDNTAPALVEKIFFPSP